MPSCIDYVNVRVFECTVTTAVIAEKLASQIIPETVTDSDKIVKEVTITVQTRFDQKIERSISFG